MELTVDDRDPVLVALDDSSLVGDGQLIDIDPTAAASRVTLRITGTGTKATVPPIGAAIGGVGFATIDVGLEPTTEMIRVPIDATDAMAEPDVTTPLSAVFTRLRTDPTDRWRSDPEPALRRQFDVPHDAAFDTSVVLRADQRIDDAALAELLDEPVTATGHLTGVPSARGASAVDGDVDTSWITPFGSPIGQALHLALDGAASTISIAQPTGTFSPITQIRISDPAGSVDVDVDPSGGDIALPRAVDLTDATFEITAVDVQTTVDRRFGEAVTLPAAISEISFDGTSPAVAPVGELVEECRDDLLQVDGAPVGVSFTASTDDILRGAPIDATLCTGDNSSVLALESGTHTITSTSGTSTSGHVVGIPRRPGRPRPAGRATGGRRHPRSDRHGHFDVAHRSDRRSVAVPGGMLGGARRGLQHRVDGLRRIRITRPADPRRWQCERLADRTDRRTDHGHVPLDRPANLEHRAPRVAPRCARLHRPRRRRPPP